VAKATREAMVVVEAAGYDIVLVETVGVGQSETAVAEMVDSFLMLALARTGDQLQGIKKGVLELVDVIAVNKADGPHADGARAAARELAAALRLLRAADSGGPPPVSTCSALDGTGLDEVWARLVAHQDGLAASGELARRRRSQQIGWMWEMVRAAVLGELRHQPAVVEVAAEVERQILADALTPALGAERLLAAFRWR
jgi:LAO/AO transport system kinase